MSATSKIKLLFTGTETFLEKVEVEFVKIFKKSATVEGDVATFIAFAAPLIEAGLALVDEHAKSCFFDTDKEQAKQRY
jgi:NADH:ubiquinone oxidoreductase subunit K